MVRPAAAGYDSDVAGLDEARARTVLADMQEQLARDPSAALGVRASATAEDVRSAFLELTKQFHPVRFGRMAVDVQKMANEVFLSLRAAHDALAKALRRQSGPISRPPSLTPGQATPVAVPTTGTVRTTQFVPPRLPARPLASHESGERAPVAPPAGSGARPGVRPVARPPGTSPIPATISATAAPTSPMLAKPAAVRPISTPVPVVARDENAVLELLQRQQWDPAKTALHQLLARDPSAKRLKAMMCYARGREAQLEGRLDDARVELHDALDLDPQLQLAKTALTELFTRRK
jgi:hypothetical protein